MLAEPSPFEQIGQPTDSCGTGVQGEKCPLDVLERRLGGPTGEARDGESGLHPGVGRDDRASQVGVGTEVVERCVESRGENLGRSPPPPTSWAKTGARPGGEHREPEQQAEDDHELLPAEMHLRGPLTGPGVLPGERRRNSVVRGCPFLMEQMPKVDVACDERQEPHAYDQDEERAKSASSATGVGHDTLPAEENECDNAEDEEQELEDDERCEDPAPE